MVHKDIIQELKSRVDIVEFIGKYVELKSSGTHFKGLCPFHNEKRPSFFVNISKQMYYCFACSIGGDVFDFIMRYDRVTFSEALEKLANSIGFELPSHGHYGEKSDHSQSLLKLLCFAGNHFQKILFHPVLGKQARIYLKKREINDETIKAFQIGYASSGRFSLLKIAKKEKISLNNLYQAGLLLKTKMSRYCDFFMNRLVIPIHNNYGKIVGFGGRLIVEAEQLGPKYLNSSEKSFFNKKKILFGFYKAKYAMIKTKKVFLVEGYMDCIRMFQEGFENVVAILGSSLTKEHVILLKRFVDTAVIIFDNDPSGVKATLRAIDLLLEAGLFVEILSCDKAKDPDEFLKRFGKLKFEEQMKSCQVDFLHFKYKVFFDKYEGKIQKALINLKFVDSVFSSLKKIDNEMLRMDYLRKLSLLLDMKEEIVLSEFKKKLSSSVSAVTLDKVQRRTLPHQMNEFEKNLALLILKNKKYFDIILDYEEKFHIQWSSSIFSEILFFCKIHKSKENQEFLNVLKNHFLENKMASFFFQDDIGDDISEKVFVDSLKKVVLNKIDCDILNLSEKISKVSHVSRSSHFSEDFDVRDEKKNLQNLIRSRHKINVEGLLL